MAGSNLTTKGLTGLTAVARDTAQALPVGHGVFTKVVDLSAKVAIGASDGVTFIAGTEKRKDKDYIKNSKILKPIPSFGSAKMRKIIKSLKIWRPNSITNLFNQSKNSRRYLTIVLPSSPVKSLDTSLRRETTSQSLPMPNWPATNA